MDCDSQKIIYSNFITVFINFKFEHIIFDFLIIVYISCVIYRLLYMNVIFTRCVPKVTIMGSYELKKKTVVNFGLKLDLTVFEISIKKFVMADSYFI